MGFTNCFSFVNRIKTHEAASILANWRIFPQLPIGELFSSWQNSCNFINSDRPLYKLIWTLNWIDLETFCRFRILNDVRVQKLLTCKHFPNSPIGELFPSCYFTYFCDVTLNCEWCVWKDMIMRSGNCFNFENWIKTHEVTSCLPNWRTFPQLPIGAPIANWGIILQFSRTAVTLRVLIAHRTNWFEHYV